MNKIKIILEVDVDDINWGRSACYPVGDGLYEHDLDICVYQGQIIEFADDDKACEYLEFLYSEGDIKDHSRA